MDKKTKSLALMIEDAKREMTNSFNQIIQRAGLPAYLIEGILCGILSDVRNQKNIELMEEMKAISSANEHGDKKEVKEVTEDGEH